MASFSSLPFEIKSRIVEIRLCDIAEDLSEQDRTAGKDSLYYWRFFTRHTFTPLAFVSKDLVYEVLRLSKRLARVWKQQVFEVASSNPCRPHRRLNKCSGTYGVTSDRCKLCHTRKLLARKQRHICEAWRFLKCVKKRSENERHKCNCDEDTQCAALAVQAVVQRLPEREALFIQHMYGLEDGFAKNRMQV